MDRRSQHQMKSEQVLDSLRSHDGDMFPAIKSRYQRSVNALTFERCNINVGGLETYTVL
jgi:hypothetical protein